MNNKYATFKPQEIFEDVTHHTEEEEIKEINERFNKLTNIINNLDFLNEYNNFKQLFMIYQFIITYEDLVKLVNMKHNKNFSDVKTISTNIEHDFLEDGCLTKYGIVLDLATNKNIEFKSKRYSYDEIKKLFDKGKIYPLFKRFIFKRDNFEIEETDTQKYFKEYNKEMVERIEQFGLNGKSIKTFVPDEINLDRDPGDGIFFIDEEYVTEDNYKLFYELFKFYLTKQNILKCIKIYLRNLQFLLEHIDYYPKAKEEITLIKEYKKTIFSKRK